MVPRSGSCPLWRQRLAALFVSAPLLLLLSAATAVLSLFCRLPTARAQAAAPGGIIAYTRDFKEIHLIAPDGAGDRLLWSHPQATGELGIFGLAWRPDGKELAFSSGHASATSLYHADLYSLRPAGTGFRRLTNAPDPREFGRFQKGTVTVPVRNSQVFITDPKAKSDIFIVYVAGASAPQRVFVPVGTAKTVTFTNVADFGKVAQAVVAIHGNYRWFIPGVDVQAGKGVRAPDLTITGDGIELLGAFRPVWRADGSAISYRNGVCLLSYVPVPPPVGEHLYRPLFSGKNPLGTCTWDWGPAPRMMDQILYTENASGDSSIYRMTEGGRHPGTKLTAFTDIQYQMLLDLHWLPDGSGFLYTNKTLFNDAANFFRYDFASKTLKQVTHFDKEFARNFSVSPDGQWVVFERGKSSDDDTPADLWIMRVDGTDQRLLVKNALRPSWGKG